VRRGESVREGRWGGRREGVSEEVGGERGKSSREMQGGPRTCHRDGERVDSSDNASGTGVLASKCDVLA
jgi:hypothetical protein